MKSIIHFLIIMAFIIGSNSPSFSQNSEQLYQKGLMKEEGEGELQDAIKIYSQIADNTDADKSLRAKALLHIGMCYEKMGKQEATNAYQRLVNNFPGQKYEVAIAKKRLSKLNVLAKKILKTPLIPKFTKIKMPSNPGNGIISPDGKNSAFISKGSVWIIPVSGEVDPYIAGEPKKLTDNIGAWDMNSTFTWSGDGKWIAFNAEYDMKSSSTSIYVVPSKGGIPQKVEVPEHRCGWPVEFRLSLSADGKLLAYATGESYGDDDSKLIRIYTIPVNGGQAKELTGPWTQEPSFSPDGSKIAFVKNYRMKEGRGWISDVWVIPSEGGTPIQVSNLQSGQVRGPIWSADGKMIAFHRRPEGENPKEIWIVPVSEDGSPTKTPKKIDLPLETFHEVAGWTPDNKIGLQLMNPPYEIIYTVPSSGGLATQVTPQGWTSYPKWSPNGEKIIFRWGGGEIASVPSGGGKVDSILIRSEFNIYSASPGSGNDISPDGKTIVFAGAKSYYKDKKKRTEVDIYTIPITGGKPIIMTSGDSLGGRFPCWSPDGNSIAYMGVQIKDNKPIFQINIVTKEGGNLKRITDELDMVSYAPIDWSPDGKSITYFSDDKTIKSISVDGGKPNVLTEIYKVNSHNELAWSPDGKELAYTDKSKIWILSKESGITKEVKTGVDERATKICWSPDGKKIAFTAFGGGDHELWLMENFLPLDKLAQKNKEKSIEVLKKMEQHLKEGSRLFYLWEYKLAIEEYESAIEFDPNSFLAQNAHYRIGQSWFKEGKYDIALTTFENLIKEFPKSYIIPVTELMIVQVKLAIKENQQTESIISVGENKIIDPETGITYRKIKSFTGKNDWITYTSGGFNMSADCRFMVFENKVVPTDGSEPFKLVDMNAGRAVYSPDMSKAAFYADSSIWMVSVSPESGRSNGIPKKLLAGNYNSQGPVSWSPDGTKIAFMMRDDSIAEDIWTISVSDLSLNRLTESPGTERSPVWSPNGNTMVYNSEGTIWQTTESMDEPKLVAKNHSRAIPRWSPDGKWLYLFGSNYDNDYLYSFEHKKEYRLNHPKQIGIFCSFTPNGDELLFYRSSFDDKWGLSIISNLGGPSFSPDLNCEVYSSQWSKDSKNMLTMSVNVKGDLTFKVIPFAGGNPVEVKIDVKVNGKPIPFEASPDLTQLIFSVKLADGLKDLYIVPLSIQKGKTMGSGRLIFEDCLSNVRLSWSPDGSKLALLHDGDIWIVPLNGEDPTQITDTPEKKRWVEWSPNGKMISYIIQPELKGSLYVMSAKGENTAIVSKDCELSKWTLDSKSLAVVSGHKLSINGLDGKILYDFDLTKDINLDQISVPSFNPNGKSFAIIAYNGEKATIYTYSFKTKEYTPIGDDIFKYDLQWSHDGQWISYLTFQTEKVRPEGTLWEADFAEIKEKLLLNK